MPLIDLVRQSIYSRLAGYEDVNDAERLSRDPAFRLIGSRKVCERGVALTSRLQSFETDVRTHEENLAGLAALNRELVARGEAIDSRQRAVLDMDSTEVPVYGQQERSAYNGHFECSCYHPLLLLFNREGDCLVAKLRPGNANSSIFRPERANSTIRRRYSSAYGGWVRGIGNLLLPSSPTPSTKPGQLQSGRLPIRVSPDLRRLGGAPPSSHVPWKTPPSTTQPPAR